MSTKQYELTNDIYDIISEILTPKTQTDDWAKMRRKFADEAKQRIIKNFKGKYMETHGNEIIIGERNPIKIKIQ